jgi:DNA-binding NarL/FixJ family response regulator
MGTIQLENEILSAREFEVLELIARGYKNREIALALKIEVRTVRFHVGNILNKLIVKNRTQAVCYALKRGWILIDFLFIQSNLNKTSL